MADFKFKKSGLFAAGVLFGTAGIKILTSKDAKKLYTGCTAAVLRAKDCIMKTATNLQENAEDIFAEAKEINEERAAAEEAVEEVETEAENTDTDMCIQAERLVLCQHTHRVNSRVNTIAQWKIDDTIFTTKSDCRLCNLFCQNS